METAAELGIPKRESEVPTDAQSGGSAGGMRSTARWWLDAGQPTAGMPRAMTTWTTRGMRRKIDGS
jgi:hypothetical protein